MDTEQEKTKKNTICILVHGFQSNKKTKQFDMVETMLQNKGIDTLRIDQYGHGEFKDDFSKLTATKAITSIVNEVKKVHSEGYKKIVLIGSSFGGLTCFFATLKCPEVSLLILKSPVTNNQGNIIARFKNLDIQKWKETGFAEWEDKTGKNKLDYAFFEDVNSHDISKHISELKIPVLIVHGKMDDVVPVEQSTMLEDYENVTVKTIPTAKHKYTEEEMNTFVSYVKSFLIKFN